MRTHLPLLLLVPLAGLAVPDRAEKLADTYREEIEDVNRDHARKPGETTEDELSKELPKKALKALDDLLELKDSPGVFDALEACGEAALDLARLEDFERVRERLLAASPEHAARLGTALSRPRFLLRGLGGLELEYLEHFAGVFDAILLGYDELFGFEEWSKVPGKKLRVRVHLEEKITRPPHFAPEFPYHSQIDFPVIDAEVLNSPTEAGQFMFYGLCHELGHVIAMWGNRGFEEDHHTWAHYTGVLLVEHLSDQRSFKAFKKHLRDVQWRSLDKERKGLEDTEPGVDDRDGTMKLWIELHDELGPRALGEAINWLDREDQRLRINRVRYYTFRDLKKGLLETQKKKKARKAIEKLLG